MVREVGSPTNSRVRDSDRRGETARSHNSPSASPRADSGHLLPHVGKNAATDPRLMRRPDDGDLSLRTSVAAKNPPFGLDRR
jgi:hypothetical protein